MVRPGYPPGWKLMSVKEQTYLLAERLELGPARAPGEDKFYPVNRHRDLILLAERFSLNQVFPAGWDGWAMIPKVTTVLGLQRKIRNFVDIKVLMPLALLRLFRALRQVYGVHGQAVSYAFALDISHRGLRLTDETAQALARLEEYDSPMAPMLVQTGQRYQNCSPEAALMRLPGNEFAMDPYIAGCVLLANTGRFNSANALWMDCAGASCANELGVFDHVPCWVRRTEGRRELDLVMRWRVQRNSKYGTATALLPNPDGSF
jgi:hypothetical protein